MPWESLHNHTTRSDGELSHVDFLREAGRRGAGVVAFTDHDALPQPADIAALQRAKSDGRHLPAWIAGVELSSGTAATGPSGAVHVVGLFVDPNNEPLQRHCQNARSARADRVAQICKNLAKIGVGVTPSDCERCAAAAGVDTAGGSALGRPHIAGAIAADVDNVRRVFEIIEELRASAATDATLRRRVDDVDARHGFEAKLYPLFLSEDAAIPGVYVPYGVWKTVAQCTELIRGAGGVSVLAHYATAMRREIPPPQLRAMLKGRAELDGAETVFGDVQGAPPNAAETVARTLASVRAEGTVVVAAGGGDIHRREQIKAYAESPFATASVGLTAGILSSGLLTQESVLASSSLRLSDYTTTTTTTTTISSSSSSSSSSRS